MRAARVLLSAAAATALDNGAMRLPPVGWNSWCAFGPCGTDVCTERQALDTIDALAANGLQAAGYDYVTLDDCYAMRRDNVTLELYPDRDQFPRGFAPLVAHAHAKGFRFGIYTSAGNYTCHAKKRSCGGPPGTYPDPAHPGECDVGSLGHYEQDAETFAKWELDFVKMDWCSVPAHTLNCETQYGKMAAALNATGRQVALYMSCGGMGRNQKWATQVANVWRIGNDHLDCWTDGPCPRAVGYSSNGHGTLQAIKYLKGTSKYAGPGGWNTPDFLKTGGESCDTAARPGDLCPKQTLVEYKTEFTAWAMASAPLLVSTDVRNLTATQRAVLLNKEVIAVDQQPVAGDAVAAAVCRAAPPPAPPAPPSGGWFVAHDEDSLPVGAKETPGVFHEFGPTADGAACQAACAQNASCTIYEWSAKSSVCWWRLDGRWELLPTQRRESGCLVGRVAGCGAPPPSPPSGDCEVWAKPLQETAYPETRGWSALGAHHAVMLLNTGGSAAEVGADLSAYSAGAMVVRDVWAGATLSGTHTGVFAATVAPHEARLYRVWAAASAGR